MALPTSYLTSTAKLPEIMNAIQGAQAPPRFTQKFLEGLGFASSADRLVINVLKSLGFLAETGEPVRRYHEYLDTSRSKQVLADGIRQAYGDLFQVKADAQTMGPAEVKNKMKTLSQGQYSEAVLQKMASTFKALAALADFSAQPSTPAHGDSSDDDVDGGVGGDDGSGEGLAINGLIYNINIHLPESRDPAVYDALFRSLRQHLVR